MHPTLTRWTRYLAMPLAAGLVLSACSPGTSEAPEELGVTGTDQATATAGTGADQAPATAETDEDPASLRVTVWTGNEDHLALFEEIGAAFAEQSDTVDEVTFDVLPFEEYSDALAVQLAGGNPPDLGWILERNSPQFVESGVLADVGDALREDPEYGFDDISESALELWTDGEAVYGYPFSTSPFAMFYNADVFAAAGHDDPASLLEAGNWTWEAAGQAAAAIVEQDAADTGLIVRDFNYEIWSNLATVWRGWGARAWSQDGTQCTFTDQEMVDAMTWFHDLAFAAEGTPGPGTSADFFTGDAGMTITQISRASLIEDQFEWGVVPLPAGPAGDQQVVGQAGLTVFEKSTNRAAATEFLKFWTNEENSRTMAQFFPPPREALLTSEVLADTNPLLSEDQLQQVVIDGIATGTPLPTHANFSELDSTIRAELDALWQPDADVPAVLDSVCTAAQSLLEG